MPQSVAFQHSKSLPFGAVTTFGITLILSLLCVVAMWEWRPEHISFCLLYVKVEMGSDSRQDWLFYWLLIYRTVISLSQLYLQNLMCRGLKYASNKLLLNGMIIDLWGLFLILIIWHNKTTEIHLSLSVIWWMVLWAVQWPIWLQLHHDLLISWHTHHIHLVRCCVISNLQSLL